MSQPPAAGPTEDDQLSTKAPKSTHTHTQTHAVIRVRTRKYEHKCLPIIPRSVMLYVPEGFVRFFLRFARAPREPSVARSMRRESKTQPRIGGFEQQKRKKEKEGHTAYGFDSRLALGGVCSGQNRMGAAFSNRTILRFGTIYRHFEF